MLKNVLRELVENDASHVVPHSVRSNIKRGILLSEGKAPRALNSLAHRMVAGHPVSRVTLQRLVKYAELLENNVSAYPSTKKAIWLMLGGSKGKRWMEKILA